MAVRRLGKQQLRTTNRGTDHMDRLEGELNEVTSLLKNNVDKILERGNELGELQERSDNLTHSTFQFRTRSIDLRRKMCYQKFKMTCIIILVIIVILAIVVLVILLTVKPWDKHSSGGHHENH